MTFVIGLTGSIGMGKSTTAAMFRARGVPVHDADETVHRLYRGEAAPLIEAAFPGTVTAGVVDRVALGARVVHDAEAMKRLEAIVHPLVRGAENAFLADARQRGVPLVVLDIPLLFETGGEGRCDGVVVASANASVQKARVMAREGMTEERFTAILDRQMPDSEKRRRAHVVIGTGHGMAAAERQVEAVIRAFSGRVGTAAQLNKDETP